MNRKTSVAVPVAHLVGPGKLRVINQRLAFTAPGAASVHLDARALQLVSCYGKVSLSDEALRLLLTHNVELALLNAAGSACLGRLVGNHDSSTALRLAQHRATANSAIRLQLAKIWVFKKMHSQMEAVRHYQKHGAIATNQAMTKIKRMIGQSTSAVTVDSLRGFEGTSSRVWFQLFASLLKEPWTFTSRKKRPATDPVNAMLSLGYTFLLNRVIAKIRTKGLELNLGCLHELRPGCPALACDVMEPLRVPAVDRWVIAECNSNRRRSEEFLKDESGGLRLVKSAFAATLESWESHWCRINANATLEEDVAKYCHELRRAG